MIDGASAGKVVVKRDEFFSNRNLINLNGETSSPVFNCFYRIVLRPYGPYCSFLSMLAICRSWNASGGPFEGDWKYCIGRREMREKGMGLRPFVDVGGDSSDRWGDWPGRSNRETPEFRDVLWLIPI